MERVLLPLVLTLASSTVQGHPYGSCWLVKDSVHLLFHFQGVLLPGTSTLVTGTSVLLSLMGGSTGGSNEWGYVCQNPGREETEGENDLNFTAASCGKLQCRRGHQESTHLVCMSTAWWVCPCLPQKSCVCPPAFTNQQPGHRGCSTVHSSVRHRVNTLTRVVRCLWRC